MQSIMYCPVCGSENTRSYNVWGCVGVCEDFYSCGNCGYFHEMSYSPYHEGIELKPFPYIVKQLVTLLKHHRNLGRLRPGRPHF